MPLPASKYSKSSTEYRYGYEKHYRNILHRSTGSLTPRTQSEREKFNLSVCTNPDITLDITFDTSSGGDDIIEASRRRRLVRSRPSSRRAVLSPPATIHNRVRSSYSSTNQKFGKRMLVVDGHVYIEQSPVEKNTERVPKTSRPRSTQSKVSYKSLSHQVHDTYYAKEVEVRNGTENYQMSPRNHSEEAAHAIRQTSVESNVKRNREKETKTTDDEEHIALDFSRSEIYYFGCLNLPMDRLAQAMDNEILPLEYYNQMNTECRVAYIYSTLLFGKQPDNLGSFYRVFNRDFFTHTTEGKSDIDALYLICKSFRDEHRENERKKAQLKLEEELKEFEEQENRLSIRVRTTTPCDKSAMEVRDTQRGPYVYRSPHSFMRFGQNGRVVTLHPDFSMNVVHLANIKSLFCDDYLLRLLDTVEMFKGPLTCGQTPPHTVGLYIQEQIKRIRTGPVSSSNPIDNDVIDCLLIWQLLHMIIQQQGRVTGPDLAQLLISACPTHSEKESFVQRNPSVFFDRNYSRTPSMKDQKAHEAFTQYLLQGHIEMALEFSMRHSLFSEALVLARRLNHRRLSEIEETYMQTKCANSPITTLLAVANNQPAKILTNLPNDDVGSWRLHAAIILANLTSDYAMSTVHQLGKVLARRDYHAAADFCLLSVALLSPYDPFMPSEDVRINLIHASLPDDHVRSTICRFGFSLVDFHATEIFSFGVSLGRDYSPLSSSKEFQKTRVQYAQLISSFGGFETVTFRYCMDIARNIWPYHQQMEVRFLTDLCDLAEQVCLAAEIDPQKTLWIKDLRQIIAHIPFRRTLKEETTEVFQEMVQQPLDDLHLSHNNKFDKQDNELYPQYPTQEEQNEPDPVIYSIQEQFTPTLSAVDCAEEQELHSRSSCTSKVYSNTSNNTDFSSDGCHVISGDVHNNTPENKIEKKCKFANDDNTVTNDTSTRTSSVVSEPSLSSPGTSPSLPQTPPPLPQNPSQTNNQDKVCTVQQKKFRSSNNSSTYGLLERLKKSMLNAIPVPNQMILPDDRKKSIVWEPVLGRYVGNGLTDEEIPIPPPKKDASTIVDHPLVPGRFRGTHLIGRLRYVNNGAMEKGTSQPMQNVNSLPSPTFFPQPVNGFGFIPTMPDQDTTTADSPFTNASSPDENNESSA